MENRSSISKKKLHSILFRYINLIRLASIVLVLLFAHQTASAASYADSWYSDTNDYTITKSSGCTGISIDYANYASIIASSSLSSGDKSYIADKFASGDYVITRQFASGYRLVFYFDDSGTSQLTFPSGTNQLKFTTNIYSLTINMITGCTANYNFNTSGGATDRVVHYPSSNVYLLETGEGVDVQYPSGYEGVYLRESDEVIDYTNAYNSTTQLILDGSTCTPEDLGYYWYSSFQSANEGATHPVTSTLKESLQDAIVNYGTWAVVQKENTSTGLKTVQIMWTESSSAYLEFSANATILKTTSTSDMSYATLIQKTEHDGSGGCSIETMIDA